MSPEGWIAVDGPVLCVGEALVVFRAERPGALRAGAAMTLEIGGAEANVAVFLSRLGIDASFAGRVGDDALGRAVLVFLRGEGVDVAGAVVDPDASTGAYERHEPMSHHVDVTYLRQGSAGSRLRPDDVSHDLVNDAGLVVLSGITLALSASAEQTVHAIMRRAHDAGRPVLFDLNLRRRLWSEEEAAPVLTQVASTAQVVVGADDELLLLADQLAVDRDVADVAEALLRQGVEEVVSRGGAGPMTARTRRDQVDYTPPEVAVVDAVGAGDCATAGYIAARRGGEGLFAALCHSAACGAMAVRSVGDASAALDRALRAGTDVTMGR